MKLTDSFDVVLVALGCGLPLIITGCSTGRVPLDPVTQSTVSAGDSSAMVQGCGNNPAVGIAYCRMTEGKSSDEILYFIAPPADCNRSACAYLKVWNNQGDLVFGAPFEKGKTRLGVSWSALLSQAPVVPRASETPAPVGPETGAVVQSDLVTSPISHTFDRTQRGFWSWNLKVYWMDPKGLEHESQAQGDIVLRVYDKAYVPLHTVTDDPAFVWSWNDRFGGADYRFKSTSSLRSFVGSK